MVRGGVTIAQEATTDARDDAATDALVAVRGLTKRFGQRTAVDDVSFSIRRGEIFGLLGPNGAGKSTTVNMVSTYLPPDAGEVTIAGHSVRDGMAVKHLVGVVPQEIALYDDLTALENADFFARIYSVPRSERKVRAQEVLEQVGLADRARHRFGTLSGGQRQRVLLARAIAAEPRLLLLDEPFNGVDAVSEQALLDAIAVLKDEGAAVVVATHDLALAHLACEGVCLLNRRQYGFGPTHATLTPARLRAAYGGHALELRGDRVVVAHA